MKRLAAAALLAAVSGCSVEFPFLLWIDSDFSLEEQCLVVEAVERWKEASSIVDVDVRIGKPPTDAAHVIEFASSYGSDATAGWTESRNPSDPRGARIHVLANRIRTMVKPENFQWFFVGVVAHEFGHHIGLHHDGDPNALMHYMLSKPQQACVTQRDLDQFCRRFGCSQIAQPCEPASDYCMIGG